MDGDAVLGEEGEVGVRGIVEKGVARRRRVADMRMGEARKVRLEGEEGEVGVGEVVEKGSGEKATHGGDEGGGGAESMFGGDGFVQIYGK